MDIIDAKRILKKLEDDRRGLLCLNHLNSPFAFKQACGAEIRSLNREIRNIQDNLNNEKR